VNDTECSRTGGGPEQGGSTYIKKPFEMRSFTDCGLDSVYKVYYRWHRSPKQMKAASQTAPRYP